MKKVNHVYLLFLGPFGTAKIALKMGEKKVGKLAGDGPIVPLGSWYPDDDPGGTGLGMRPVVLQAPC